MHKFLRAIGFSNLRKKDLKIVLDEVIEKPEVMKITKDSEGNEFAEFTKQFAENAGITVRGVYDEEDSFQMEYYFPYVEGTQLTTEEIIDIEKHAEKESYVGVCDEMRVGVSLIFYLQNVVDYLSERQKELYQTQLRGASLSALSVEGKILLPIMVENKSSISVNKNEKRNKLMAEAREGNEEAIENLTIEDMNIYSSISKRIHKEDVLSIVNSYFMPYGVESDQYSILGEIIEVQKTENVITKESLYNLKIECNDLIFDILINATDLLGEPKIGRRFKGNIWMQGMVSL